MVNIGKYIYQLRKPILFLWLVLIIGFSILAIKLPSVLSGNGFAYDGDYQETEALLEQEFNQAKSQIILLFEREAFISDEKWKDFISNTFIQIEDLPGVENKVTPFEHEGMMKGNLAYGLLMFDKDSEEMDAEINQLRKLLPNETGMDVSPTGEPVVVKDLNEASQKDLVKAEMIGLPIALLVLIAAFGSLVAASVPLLIGIISIIITMGILYLLSFQMNFSIFLLNIVPMIGLALSIDFALLFINRYKEEIRTKEIHEAISITIATAGRSIIFSGLCVFIGLLGLLFIKIDLFMNVAVGGMVVVFVSVLSAVTFLPALLSLLGKKINSLSVIKSQNDTEGVWRRFAIFVMKRPVSMMLLALSILLISLVPVKDMNLTIPGLDALPPNYEARIALETYRDVFIDENKNEEHKVIAVLETPGDVLEEENLTKIKETIDKIIQQEKVSLVESPFSLLNINSAEEMTHLLALEDNNPEVMGVLDRYSVNNKMVLNVYFEDIESAKTWVRFQKDHSQELNMYLGGSPTFEQEIFDEIYEKSPYGLALILATTFFILMVAFRSLLIPIKAIAMNILSLLATFGIIVWIFQQGHLGINPSDISLMVPVFVFSLVFGLSMDYEVFFISRIHENYLESGNNDEATVEGLATTSKIITSAAAIMIVVTGAFGFTGVMPVKQVGVGIAIAIFIDATIVRMLLVPSLMKLFGDWNWWYFGKKKIERG
ncbi:MMPL family transporter [Litchfieldia alkalitelluris]|uniref:MMPL family transporter n=1 Tax=Litchfieldia alkalitelluris TaxID=304268 RepID=UPI000996F38D|nr:MMPL family transporter [Litchfieldia alkalitelluris]